MACGARATLATLTLVTLMASAHAVAQSQDAELLARGYARLRAMDCARCHGRDYEGSVGPSLLAAVKDGDRARFDRIVLDGEIARGMPGYRSQPAVVADLDAMYAYLVARARGEIPPGKPAGAAEPATPIR